MLIIDMGAAFNLFQFSSLGENAKWFFPPAQSPAITRLD
jgi:hypothetical protein